MLKASNVMSRGMNTQNHKKEKWGLDKIILQEKYYKGDDFYCNQ